MLTLVNLRPEGCLPRIDTAQSQLVEFEERGADGCVFDNG